MCDRFVTLGFKTDLRILIDLVCGKWSLSHATDKKVSSDMSKLAREGKEAKTAIRQIYDSSDQDY